MPELQWTISGELVTPSPDVRLNRLDLQCAECDASPADMLSTGDHAVCPTCYANRYVRCEDCSADVDRDEALNGLSSREFFCVDCHDERFTSCDRCGDSIHVDGIRTPECGPNRDAPLCESCYDYRYISCRACDVELHREGDYTHRTNDGEFYCDTCYGDEFTSCDSCGCELSTGDAVRRGDFECLCESCYDDEDDEDDAARPAPPDDGYHFSARPFTLPTADDAFVEIRSKLTYGVELETSKCEGYMALKGSVHFSSKEDGSISGEEFESTILAGDAGLDAIRDFCDKADDLGFAVDTNCGYHVHFGVGAFSVEELKRIARAYYHTYDVWKRFVSMDRAGRSFCAPIGWSLDSLADVEDMEDFERFAMRASRYTWFNIKAYFKHSTFEIRLHSASLNPAKIINWIKAHARFMDAVAAMSDAELDATFSYAHTSDEKFANLADIWDDTRLASYYASRALHFGQPFTLEAIGV